MASTCRCFRGTQQEILRKRPKNNNKAWIKLCQAILNILGDCWGKCICSSLPGRPNGRLPSQQGAPKTCKLTYWEVSQQTYVQTLLASLGVVKGQNSPLQWRKKGKGFWQITLSSYSRHQISSDSLNYLSSGADYPADTFLPRTSYFFHISQPAKIGPKNRYFEERLLRAPETKKECVSY